ncbi:MAG: hypothetical protein ACM3XR_01155 [Bacillota bacterium]
MKSVEIKRIEGKSVFKATLYIGCIPAAIFIFIGMIMLLLSVIASHKVTAFMGIYMLFCGTVYIVLGGLLNWFVSFIYNIFARRFGGIKMDIVIEEDEKMQFYQ